MVDGVASGAKPPVQQDPNHGANPAVFNPAKPPSDIGKQSENAYEVKKTGGEKGSPVNF